jgi:hypothetical protein
MKANFANFIKNCLSNSVGSDVKYVCVLLRYWRESSNWNFFHSDDYRNKMEGRIIPYFGVMFAVRLAFFVYISFSVEASAVKNILLKCVPNETWHIEILRLYQVDTWNLCKWKLITEVVLLYHKLFDNL